MLACIDPRIEFHPLKLHAIADVYRGQLGVRRWLAHVEQERHDHVLRVPRVESNELSGALIIRAQHYLSSVETLVGLGIVAAELRWPSRTT